MVHPTFSSFEDVSSLQALLVDGQPAESISAKTFAYCTAMKETSDPASLQEAHKLLLSNMFVPILSTDNTSATWDTALSVLGSIRGSILAPFIDKEGTLHVSVFSAPVVKDRDNGCSQLLGLRDKDALTRTAEFDVEGIMGGDAQVSIASYYQSPINRLRFVSTGAPRPLRTEVKALFRVMKEVNGRPRATYDNFYTLTNGNRFSSATSGDGLWIRQEPNVTSGFEFPLPAVLPLPPGHNIVLTCPARIEQSDEESLIQAFRAAGVPATEDISWFLHNPIVKLWLHSLLNDPAPFVPRNILGLPFNSLLDQDHYEGAVECIRVAYADWEKNVQEDPALWEILCQDNSLISQQEFPPNNIQIPSSLPPYAPAFEFPTAPVPQPAATTAEEHPHQFRSSPVTIRSSPTMEIARPIPHNVATLRSSQPQRNWMGIGAIDHSNRARTIPATVLTAHIPNLKLQGIHTFSGNPIDLPASKEDHFLLAPFQQCFKDAFPAQQLSKSHCGVQALIFEEMFYHVIDRTCLHLKPTYQEGMGNFFTALIFEKLLGGNLNQRRLVDITVLKSFSVLHFLLMHKDCRKSSTVTSPLFPASGFDRFEDIQSFFEICKWFLNTIFHPEWAEHTILFKGIVALEQFCISKRVNTLWNHPASFDKAGGTYVILSLTQELFSICAGLSGHVPEESFFEGYRSFGDSNDIQLCNLLKPSGFGQDPSLALSEWISSFDENFKLCGICTHSLIRTNVSALEDTIKAHPLFFTTDRRSTSNDITVQEVTQPSKRQRTTRSPVTVASTDIATKDQDAPDRTKKSSDNKLSTPPDPSLKILVPAGKFSIGDLLEKHKADPVSFTPKTPPGKQKYLNLKPNCRFCFRFLLGETCNSQTKCGYHLYVSDLLRENKEPLTFFKTWLESKQDFVKLSDSAASLPSFV